MTPTAIGDNPASEGALAKLARGFAIGGGLVFCGLVAMSLVSIVGRKLFASPILGDQEILMCLAALASAAFLPYCELHDQHIRVDVFTGSLPPAARGAADAIAHTLLLIMALLIAWRTTLQALQDAEVGNTTQIMHLPMWLANASLVPSFLLLAVCAGVRVRRALAACAQPAAATSSRAR